MSVRQSVRDSGALFSDLNQWMLKVLLAPELPDALLASPRGQYRNASQLARAANVSVMSAFRFVQLLEREGYLHEAASSLRLVRREDLFNRWQALSARSPREVPMRFLLPGDRKDQLRRMLGSGRACLALFAAADALRLGFVSGVPPYVYVQRIQPANLAAWKNLESASRASRLTSSFGRRRHRSPCSVAWCGRKAWPLATFCRSGSTWRRTHRADGNRRT